MLDLPVYIPISFIVTAFLTVFLFVGAVADKKIVISIILVWALVQFVLGYSGYYLDVRTKPFKFLVAAPPTLLAILLLFLTEKGRKWMDKSDSAKLTLVHTIRIPVELLLYALFVHKTVPELMTFSGRNFDILAGISAPLIYYFWGVKKSMAKTTVVLWNVVCLILLLNIVIHAILSVPLPIQQFAFDQPNIAILYSPFIWLPTLVVPLVLFSHLATLRRLLKS